MVNKFLVFNKEKIFIPKNPAFAEEPRYGGHGKEALRKSRVKDGVSRDRTLGITS